MLWVKTIVWEEKLAESPDEEKNSSNFISFVTFTKSFYCVNMTNKEFSFFPAS